jgi:RHS repeat-associated protein
LEWTRNRLNDLTTFLNDELGRTTRVTDPENRVTEFRYNGANQITNLITWVSGQQRVKEFEYTSTNGFSRLTRIRTPMGKLTRHGYTLRGGLAWREDGNGRVTKFQYDPLYRLASVSDTEDNVLVRMDYDVLGNMTCVSNAHSVFQYAYDGLNRATQAVCLLTNMPGFSTVKYRIAYSFDPVGNMTNRAITGLQGFTDTIHTVYGYDVMNRLTNVVQLTNGVTIASAWYSYDSVGRLWKKGYGNGDVVTHAYDAENRLLSMSTTNTSTLVMCYAYKWNSVGNITAITNNGTNVALYGYDRAGQLTNEVLFTNSLARFTTNTWQYDEAGNWLNANPSNRWRYNTDNELIARAANSDTTWNTTVTGEVEPGANSNKWLNTWASCRGVSARVRTNDGAFVLPDVPLNAGTNELVVTVTDVSGNQSQQVRKIKKNALEIFHYDGNGNLTNWVVGTTNWVYEWDVADRLTKVSSNGIIVLENWYDSGSRRLAKTETVAGQISRCLYISDGWDVVGVSDETGQFKEIFTRGIGLRGDIGTLVGVTRVPGGTNPGKFYAHHNHRGDVTTVRNGGTTTTTYGYSAYGNLVAQTGTDVCRFGFSSKEREASCGWSYYGYRFYAPQWQRWISDDFIGESGSLNLFQFLANIPTVALDPNGLQVYYPPGGHDNAFWRNLGRCWGIASDRRSEYRELINSGRTRPGTDRWFHCATSCEMAGECGDSIATAIGNLQEWWNSSVDTIDTFLDQEANRDGRDCNCKGRKECEKCCFSRGYNK